MTGLFLLLAFIGRLSGGLFSERLPKWSGGAPEIIFGLVFAAFAFNEYGFIAALIAFILAWRGLEFGHDTGYHMGNRPDLTEKGDDRLKPIVSWICMQVNFPIGGKIYCWIHMGIKGAFIGAATLSFWGLSTVLLFPLGYEIAWQLQKKGYINQHQRGALAEILSCGFSGIPIYITSMV